MKTFKRYAPKAVFRDPLVHVSSRENVFAQFYSLSLFKRVSVSPAQPTDTKASDDSHNDDADDTARLRTIAFDNQQDYHVSSAEGDPTLSINVTTTLLMEFLDGRWVVKEHHDHWYTVFH